MNLILNGASGCGKGSMAGFLVRDFGLVHISTGDLFREQIAKKTPLGQKLESYVSTGQWVPDEVTIEVLLDRMKQPDCTKGVILDGFPRTLNQAIALDKVLKVDLVIAIDVTDDIVQTRLGGRYMCRQCGTIHAARWDKIDKCKKCGGELYQRDDDKAEFIQKRLDNFKKNNGAILDFYRDQNKLFVVHDKLENTPADTYAMVKDVVAKL
ncbi:MAG: nucleoside monophosphate kinase [Eubacteriales bacterium]|nr:nucleoside monophosphate kinase [Eubacteriales bacterium]